MGGTLNLYGREYYLNDCEGFRQFLSSKGFHLSPRLKKVFSLAEVKAGEKILDLGCGRGELVLHSALSGATAFGADFSGDAVSISRAVLEYWKRKKGVRAVIVKARAGRLPFADSFFDAVIMSDFAEHLPEKELKRAAAKVWRVLRPGGKAVLHTSPNRIFFRWGLPLCSLIGRISGLRARPLSSLPEGLGKDYHPNLLTVFSLKRIFRGAGFRAGRVFLEKNPHYLIHLFGNRTLIPRINALYRVLPFGHLFCADIYAVFIKSLPSARRKTSPFKKLFFPRSIAGKWGVSRFRLHF